MSNIGRFVELIGPARTKELIFTARMIEAAEALAIGLPTKWCPTWRRSSAEPPTAKPIAGQAPMTMEVAKEAVLRVTPHASREEGRDLMLRAYMSDDFREGMDAFLNKRTRPRRLDVAVDRDDRDSLHGTAPPSSTRDTSVANRRPHGTPRADRPQEGERSHC